MKEETVFTVHKHKIYLYKYSITIAYQQVCLFFKYTYIYIFMVRPISLKNVKSIQKEYQWLWYKNEL